MNYVEKVIRNQWDVDAFQRILLDGRLDRYSWQEKNAMIARLTELAINLQNEQKFAAKEQTMTINEENIARNVYVVSVAFDGNKFQLYSYLSHNKPQLRQKVVVTVNGVDKEVTVRGIQFMDELDTTGYKWITHMDVDTWKDLKKERDRMNARKSAEDRLKSIERSLEAAREAFTKEFG